MRGWSKSIAGVLALGGMALSAVAHGVPSLHEIQHHFTLQEDGGRLVVDYSAQVGSLLQQAVWDEIDRNEDGRLDLTEQRQHAEKLAQSLQLRVNGKSVRWQPESFQYPLRPEQLGSETATLRVRLIAPLPNSPDCSLTLQNHAFPQFPSAPLDLTSGSGFTTVALSSDGRSLRAHFSHAGPTGSTASSVPATELAPPSAPTSRQDPAATPSEPSDHLDAERLFPRREFKLVLPKEKQAPAPDPRWLALALLSALFAGFSCGLHHRGKRDQKPRAGSNSPDHPLRTTLPAEAAGMLGCWIVLQAAIRLAGIGGFHLEAHLPLLAGLVTVSSGAVGLHRLQTQTASPHQPRWIEAGTLALASGITSLEMGFAAIALYIAALTCGRLQSAKWRGKSLIRKVETTAAILLILTGSWLAGWALLPLL